MSTHLEKLKFRLMVVDLLKAAKDRYTYRELSSMTGLPVTVLSRYAKGHVLPSAEEKARGQPVRLPLSRREPPRQRQAPSAARPSVRRSTLRALRRPCCTTPLPARTRSRSPYTRLIVQW